MLQQMVAKANIDVANKSERKIIIKQEITKPHTMDYKKSKAPTNTVTHNLMDFCEGTDNIYESVAIMAKRANQISVQMKEEIGRAHV